MRRLFILSNRLPLTVTHEKNEVSVRPSSGGLVSAISSYLNQSDTGSQMIFSERIWVGIPGCSSQVWDKAREKTGDTDFDFIPVFLNQKVYDNYYNGLSNSVLWPLFHYFPSYADYNSNYFEAYKTANQAFVDTLVPVLNEEDILWIHDYHLLSLAGKIREHFPRITIGFFLHIPFPSYEVFRLMPTKWQEELLKGMLGADLIGFHTIDYAAHFLETIQMVMGLESERHIVTHNNRLIKIDVFPISIDYNKYHHAWDRPEVRSKRTEYQKQFEGKRIIFSVDRLDYTKGVYSRLKAYERFLKKYPSYHGNVVFIMVIVPSRDTIKKYADRKREIDEYIGDINSRIGNITWKPVIYQYSHLEFDDLLALYTACDLALITPLRDGMNLVAKEFVTSRKDLKGVLVLSEMAGAARELSDALTINPNDLEGTADKIREGLEMPVEQQSIRLSQMQKRISQYDIIEWAGDFMSQLSAIKTRQQEFEFRFLNHDAIEDLIIKYQGAEKKLLLLDYDGTLVSFSSAPEKAAPESSVLRILEKLAADSTNEVYIISGRDSYSLEKWLGHLPINIVAEHGAKIKIAGKGWKTSIVFLSDENWKQSVKKVMEQYQLRCAHSFIEVKDYSIAWHFRNSDQEQAKVRSAELFTELNAYTNDFNIQIFKGNKVIEVRIKGIDKGFVVKEILKKNQYDFILACGDDYTDEDMFKALSKCKEAFTIKIGYEASFAQYNLYTPQMTISLLEMLSRAAAGREENFKLKEKIN
jgi:trehalose 6-phosphate synthase/phosphatase